MMEPIILPRISDKKPLASVVSITYNHEPYIRDCLEGFLMQKTDFPIEIIIHDDASTDHTADIIREYYEKRPDLFHVIIEKENQYYRKDILMPLFEQAQGKYIALCEGDDFWIDPLKLQKQFDFMKSHPKYSMCGTRVKLVYEKERKWAQRRSWRRGEITLNQIMCSNPYPTCTMLIRTEIIRSWVNFSTKINKKKWRMGDYPMWIFCTTKGNGYILPDITTCYRVLNNSASHGNPQKMELFFDGGVHIRLKLIKELGIPFSSERILKQWSYGRVKLILKKKLFVPKRRLMFFWRFYWKGHVHPKPIRFVIMFVMARFCWLYQMQHSKG